ncbi:MAG: bifunctional diaminohydroxyphosphoribosylaminopyrimidine deaminase/5-amino-6-(5-phosphoribosylamino)uracil reductase RibD [Bacteroidales bacterium]|jgi:diaminohydroxyphosphoribosylaminopyrimidine deaminase/5-amino-6-(5-phosphoribosylamino)uracil reductase|nr:bifunctional diaminohydroxyphosphoribosylaminopyrimidine deaminase/5-amino-6-(5-phosphoribosylamino)uracil reductase RibD [Bacteroidales bacterium]
MALDNTQTHLYYMQRALALAKHGQLHTSPNPMVGCVIVYKGEIIGEGYHTQYGKPHAEVNAIHSVEEKERLAESTLYVTLEPCSHFGKTPPCADLIAQYNIPHAVVAVQDPNPKVSGNGIEKLRHAGCKVEVGIGEEEAKALNKRFFCFHQQQRPFIILKWAETLDGFLDCNGRGAENREDYWITNEHLRYRVHKWRAAEDAVFVGANTVLYDDPMLNIRYYAGKNPTRVTFLSKSIAPHFHLFDRSQPSIIFNTEKEEQQENIYFCKTDKTNFWQEMMWKLYTMKIQSLMVEGGQRTLQQLIDLNLWDEARILKGNTCFGSGLESPRFPFMPYKTEDCSGDKIIYYKNDKQA